MDFFEMLMAAAMVSGALVGTALMFFLFFYMAAMSMNPKKKEGPKDVDTIISQARHRARISQASHHARQ